MKKINKKWATFGIVMCVLIGMLPRLAAEYASYKLEKMGYTGLEIGKARYSTQGIRFENVKFVSADVRGSVGEIEVIPGSKRVVVRRGSVVVHSEKASPEKGSSEWRVEAEDLTVYASTGACETLVMKVLYKTEQSMMVQHVQGLCQGAVVEATNAERNSGGWTVQSASMNLDHLELRTEAVSPSEKKSPKKISVQNLDISYGKVNVQSTDVTYENRILSVGKSEIVDPSHQASVIVEGSEISTLQPGEKETFGVPKYKFRSKSLTASIGKVGRSPMKIEGVKIDIYPFLMQYEATIGEVFWVGGWNLNGGNEGNQKQAYVDMPDVACEAVKNLVPAGEEFKRLQLKGEMAAILSVSVGPKIGALELRSADVELKMHDSCKFDYIPDVYRDALEKPVFTIDRVNSKGVTQVTTTGPGKESWTRYESISPHMTMAVLATEDLSFFQHSGVSIPNIQEALRDDIQLGRFRRGGSTITMQLAKNLWLQREKTLSRKMQEFFLTQLLEEKFNKKKILEYYFNIIEFGPDLYGIREAAEQLFGSRPSSLTLVQSLALAILLPNPRAEVVKSGVVSDKYQGKIRKLLHGLNTAKKISDSELVSALDELGQETPSSWSLED